MRARCVRTVTRVGTRRARPLRPSSRSRAIEKKYGFTPAEEAARQRYWPAYSMIDAQRNTTIREDWTRVVAHPVLATAGTGRSLILILNLLVLLF